jgi:putative DNA primase/helicase
MSLEILASQPWFTDGLGDIQQKDVVDQMTGKWIIELAELASIRGRENEHIKSFLTRQVDRVRMSYGRRSEDYPRQSIFMGSTNSSEYFTDETGNRRYWPIRVNEANRTWLKQNRDPLWAEAMMRYELGEPLYLPKQVELLARREQESRFEVDEWENEIRKIISKSADGGPYVTTELWRAINITSGNGHPNLIDTHRIGKIMRRLGFKRTALRVDGVLGKCWVKHET